MRKVFAIVLFVSCIATTMMAQDPDSLMLDGSDTDTT